MSELKVLSTKVLFFIFLVSIIQAFNVGAQVIEVENMAIKTAGTSISGGWFLDNEGYVADSVNFLSDNFYYFKVRAKGAKYANEWPLMTVGIDNLFCGPVEVEKSYWRDYTVFSPVASGKHQLSLSYINDLATRGLYLDRVTIGRATLDEEYWLQKLSDSILRRFAEPSSYSIVDWQFEELMWGIAKTYEITGDVQLLSYVRSYLDDHIDNQGNLDTGATDLIPGILLIWLYMSTGETRYLQAAMQVGEYMLNEYPRTSDGGYVHQPENIDQLWVDTMGGLGRFMGLMGHVTADNRYFDEGVNQMIIHANHLQDISSGLFYHGWDEDGSAEWATLPNNCSSCFWARGNGWAIRGLTDLLEYLPLDYPQRGDVLTILQKLIAGLAQYQENSSGLWFTVLDRGGDGVNYLETSASTLLAYGIQKAITLDLASENYREIVNRANLSLYRKVYEKTDGEVIVTGVSAGTMPGSYENYISKPVRTGDYYPYGDGLLLQEKSEIIAGIQRDLAISNIIVSDITDTAAVITWSTNKLSESQVEYGTTINYGKFTPNNSLLVKTHHVVLNGLSENTTYHFRAISRDLHGEIAVSDDQIFTTLTTPNLSFSDISVTSGFSGPIGNYYTGGHCVAFADVDNDDLPDLYLSIFTGFPISDKFFHNLGNNQFVEESVARGIDDFDGGTHGVSFADFDNDGDFDLLNGSTKGIAGDNATNNLYINNGSGYFVDITNATPLEMHHLPTRGVLAFDAEGDGDLDIFCVSNYLGTLDPPGEFNEFYLNDGNFHFADVDSGALYQAPAGQGATAVDFDNDGDVDVFAGNRTGPLNILRNDGKGEFSIVPPLSIGISHPGREGVTFGDIDNDGDLDILMVGDSTGYFGYLYNNNGNGTFGYNRSFQDIDGFMGAFADVDNDCDLDIIFSGDDVCYLNDGTGNFSAGPQIPVNGVNDPRAISFADIDNDGDLDFAVACKMSRSFLIRNNLKTGNWLKIKLISEKGQVGAFGAKVFVYPGGEAGAQLLGYREALSCQGYLGHNDAVLHFGLNQHQTADVIVIFPNKARVMRTHVAANQTIVIEAEQHPESKLFTDVTVETEINFDTLGHHGISVADIDGDNDPDIYINNRRNSEIPQGDYAGNYLLKNEAGRSFTTSEQLSGVQDIASSACAALFFDMDNDGDFDLTVGHGNDGLSKRGLFKNNGNGVFTQVDAVSGFHNTGDIGTKAILAGDMNGDQKFDLFFSSRIGYDTEYYLGNGNSYFMRTFGLNDKVSEIIGMTMADIDGDQDLDVMICDNISKGVRYYRNNGYGVFTFTNGTGLPQNEKVTNINLADIDNDNDLDALIHGHRDGFSDLYRKSGNSFQMTQSFPLRSGDNELNENINGIFADFDNDGNVDLFLPAGAAKLWFNNGNGDFSPVSDSTSGFEFVPGQAKFPVVLDYDLDGDLDVFISQAEGPVKLYRNNFDNHQFLRFKLFGPRGDAGGFGSKVWLFEQGHLNDSQYLVGFQESMASTGYCVQNEPIVHFGLNNYHTVDVKIQFIDGIIKTITNVAANQVLTIRPDEHVSTPMTPAGPDTVILGNSSYFMTGGALCNTGHDVEYQFDWGDSSFSEWGDSMQAHIYDEIGSYDIKSRARCQSSQMTISEWSAVHQIYIRGLYLALTIFPDNSGSVEVDPQKVEYDQGDSVVLTAIANNGFSFSQWSGDLQGADNPVTVRIEHDLSVRAEFIQFAETIEPPQKPVGPDTGILGESLNFYATGAASILGHPLEYQFDWGDNTKSSWGDSSNIHVYSAIDTFKVKARARCQNHTSIVSDWSELHKVYIRGLKLSLTVKPDSGGLVLITPGKSAFAILDTVVLLPQPEGEFYFDHWSGDLNGNQIPGIIIMNSDKTVSAQFDHIEENVTKPVGIIGPSEGIRNQPLFFTASGALSNLSRELEFQFDWGDQSLSYWGDSVRSKSYSISGNFSVHARARSKQNPTVISEWSDSLNLTITGCNVEIEFTPDGSGYLIKTPDKIDYDFGEEITLNCFANPGFKFQYWNSDIQDTTLKKMLVMHNDTTLVAHFKMFSTISENNTEIPTSYKLFQNYPNPFNSNTIIRYQVPKNCEVSTIIYDINGRLIKKLYEGNLATGIYTRVWQGDDYLGNKMPTGVYFCKFTSENFSQIKKMILMK